MTTPVGPAPSPLKRTSSKAFEDEKDEPKGSPTSSPQQPQIKTIILHTPSDLTLNVGDPSQKVYHIHVNAQTMRMMSPVWSTMLDPAKGWKESSSNTLDLDDDDPDALLVLLQIAHLKFKDIKRVTHVDELFQLAILCDKYDVTALIGPFLKAWIDGMQTTCPTESLDKWLFIAWVFGMIKIYKAIAKSISLSVRPLSRRLRSQNRQRNPLNFSPPGSAGKQNDFCFLDNVCSPQLLIKLQSSSAVYEV